MNDATVVVNTDKFEDIKVKEKFITNQVFLPSLGKVYEKGSPLANAEHIEIREMTAREEDILTSRILLKKGIAIDKILENCIINKKIDHHNLLMGDRNAITLALRIFGYGTDYNVQVKCPVCSTKQNHNFNLAEIQVRTLSDEPVEENKNAFLYTFPKTKASVIFKFLTSGEEAEISKSQDNFRKITGSDVDNFVTTRLIKQIISIDGNTNRNFIADFVNRLPIYDSRAFRQHIESIEPDTIMKSQFICNSCNEENEIDVPLTTEFFWPAGIR
jgi:hypothetical protein